MNDETIVAVFDNTGEADAAMRDLQSVVPASAISRHAAEVGSAAAETGAAPKAREPGFWSSLFGGEPDHDTQMYDRSLERGGVVITVRATAEQATRIIDILERHKPVDLDERASRLGLPTTAGATAVGGTTAGSLNAGPASARVTAPGATSSGIVGRTTASTGDSERLELAEESLVVGKRAINRGTTRVRRFVVETPVEQQVTLHGETVDVQRRPVTDGRAANTADFSDKTIEMAETDEEAVVSKTARVKEEVVLNKTARDRVETVRDTVRREDVKVENASGAGERGGRIPAPRPATGPASPPR